VADDQSAVVRQSDIDEMVRRLIMLLIQYREDQSLTQVELAKRTGIGYCTMSRLENNHHEPKLGAALAWAAALGYTFVLTPIRVERPAADRQGGNNNDQT
jgi:transcriptional regulator with XRE-family HTH domain